MLPRYPMFREEVSTMGAEGKILIEMYERLLRTVGPRHWWPGESPFEVIVGAILTQNTSWANVEKAIENLKKARILTPTGIRGLEVDELAQVIKPSGFYRLKASRLKRFVDFFHDEFDDDMSRMRSEEPGSLRERLLKVDGIGPETADSILLYALENPIFVVDAYTKRIFSRHDLISEKWNYEEVQEMVMGKLDRDVGIYNEFHALLVFLGKYWCRKIPRCGGCPLEGL
ncbi:MAG: endonuclease III domain-containing protein [Thermodesulfobacteriota bacterium]